MKITKFFDKKKEKKKIYSNKNWIENERNKKAKVKLTRDEKWFKIDFNQSNSFIIYIKTNQMDQRNEYVQTKTDHKMKTKRFERLKMRNKLIIT